MRKIDTSKFDNADQFQRAINDLVPPEPPKLKHFDVREEDFDSYEAYLASLPSMVKAYEAACDSYDEQRQLRNLIIQEISSDFQEWCFRDLGMDHLPEDVRSGIFSYAISKREFDGLSGTYQSLKDLSHLVLDIHEVGPVVREEPGFKFYSLTTAARPCFGRRMDGMG